MPRLIGCLTGGSGDGTPDASPIIGLSTFALTQSVNQGSDAVAQTFDVHNAGAGTLTYVITDNVSWLSCAPTPGTSTGEADTITVTYDTDALAAGVYHAIIQIADVLASNNPQQIAVTLTVNALRIIELSDVTLYFEVDEGSNHVPSSFTVRNSGGGTLSYAITDDVLWLSCAPTPGTSTGEADTITITFSTAGLAAGDYNATITVTDPAATNNPQTINVTLNVIAAPVPSIGLSDTSFTYTIEAGDGLPDINVDVNNDGTGILNWTVDDDADWLLVEPVYGSSDGQAYPMNISFGVEALPPGVYTGIITITDPAADDSPRTITIHLTVTGTPEIELSETAMHVEVFSGSNHAPVVFTVRNSGSGTLNYSISDNVAWLSCLPISGTSVGELDNITITFATSGLAIGTYVGIITVTDPAASNNPQTLTVTLVVNPVPQFYAAIHPGNDATLQIDVYFLFYEQPTNSFANFVATCMSGFTIGAGQTAAQCTNYQMSARPAYIGYFEIDLVFNGPLHLPGTPFLITTPANNMIFPISGPLVVPISGVTQSDIQ